MQSRNFNGLILLALSLSACGQAPANDNGLMFEVDSRVLKHVQTFQQALGRPLVRIREIGFKSLVERENENSKTILGMAEVYSNGMSNIYFNSDRWDKLKLEQQTWTVYHELGHAECLLDHDDTEEHGEATSIMHTYVQYTDLNTLHSYYLPRLIADCNNLEKRKL